MPDLVSILIPCYNADRWLEGALASALAQTWANREIILVDDGSTDGSLAIARRYEDRGVTVISQANRGASAARNAALAASRGDWLQFLDADDLLAPDKIERQMQAAVAADPASLFCGRWTRFRNAPADGGFPTQLLCRDAAPVDWVVDKFEQNAMMHPASWLTPRDLAERGGPWNESLSLDDDGEYFTRLVLISSGVRHCGQARSYYRSFVPGSLSSSRSERAWDSAFHSLELSIRHLLTVENSSRTQHACATACQRYVYEAFPRAPASRRRAAALAAAMGGSEVAPSGGRKFQLARRFLGWRLAKILTGR